MNGFYCRIGGQDENHTFSFDSRIKTKVLTSQFHETELTCFSNSDTLFAVHEDDNYLIVFNGYLQFPLVDWTNGAPADSSLVAAQYLLNRYKTTGHDFLCGINGCFSIIIICKADGSVICSTDNDGNRRLFYVYIDDVFYISTHLYCLRNLIKNIDYDTTAFFLSYEFLPRDNTIYKNVKSLDSNVIISFSNDLNFYKKELSCDKIQAHIKNATYAIDLLYNEFKSALKEQLPTEKKVAVLLGGFDSALVAAMLVKLGKDVETFTFDFEDSSYNQANVKELEEVIGCKSTLVRMSPEIMKKGLLNYAKIFNQPSSQAHYLIHANYAASVIREKGYKYCFTGDGCDEIFLGYPTVIRRAVILDRFKFFPKKLATILKYIAGCRFIESNFAHLSRIIRNILLMLERSKPASGFVANRIFDEFSLSRLTRAFNSFSETSLETEIVDLAQKYKELSVCRMALKGKAMVGVTRNKTEGSSLYNGVVLQSPFNQKRFRQVVSRIDDELLRPTEKSKKRKIGKYVFVEMVRKYKLLPENIIFQEKASPVTAPVDSWYANELKNDIIMYIDDAPFKINRKYILNLMRFRYVEDLYRKRTLSRYLFQPISLIVTYTRYFSKKN